MSVPNEENVRPTMVGLTTVGPTVVGLTMAEYRYNKSATIALSSGISSRYLAMSIKENSVIHRAECRLQR